MNTNRRPLVITIGQQTSQANEQQRAAVSERLAQWQQRSA
jgi:hypothetical protein